MANSEKKSDSFSNGEKFKNSRSDKPEVVNEQSLHRSVPNRTASGTDERPTTKPKPKLTSEERLRLNIPEPVGNRSVPGQVGDLKDYNYYVRLGVSYTIQMC